MEEDVPIDDDEPARDEGVRTLPASSAEYRQAAARALLTCYISLCSGLAACEQHSARGARPACYGGPA